MKQVISVRDLEEMLRHGKDVRSLHAEALLTPSRRNTPLRSMSEYHKCTCPHCGQSIEYPAEGTGQTVPCPTCEKPFRLFPEIAIPAVKITVALAPTKKPVEQKDQPATEQQKEKLQFFGCTWTGEITVGQASDALFQCARDFPDREEAWVPRRPAVRPAHSKEWDAWLVLLSQKRLKARQEQSEGIAPEEVTIQDAATRQNENTSEYLVPAREVQDSEPRRPAVRKPSACKTTLYYREGSSDKVYQASIEPQGVWFVVNFAYGRRGSTMNTGTKTQTPVDFHSAKSIYDNLVWEKKAKGYTEGPGGTQPNHSAKSIYDNLVWEKKAKGYTEGPGGTQPKRFALDMARVDEITNETKEVVSILSVVMEHETEKSVARPASTILPATETPRVFSDGKAAPLPTRYKGLDPAFHPILERLMARDSWPQTDFKALAVEFHVMPLKIRDTLNEWSDEALGDFICDGEDPVLIHRELVAKETTCYG